MNTARLCAVLLAAFWCQGTLFGFDRLDAPGRGYREQRDGRRRYDLFYRFPDPHLRVGPPASKESVEEWKLLGPAVPTVPPFVEPAWLKKDFSLSLEGTPTQPTKKFELIK